MNRRARFELVVFLPNQGRQRSRSVPAGAPAKLKLLRRKPDEPLAGLLQSAIHA